MKKHIAKCLWVLALVAALSASFAFGAEGGQATGAADVVVLLDVSQSVLPYFEEAVDYVVASVVRDYLRLGDTFHLLTFGETTQVEIAQRISDERDVKSALGRLYLLYPLSRNTDLVAALGYLYQYLADLPNRQKIVVVVTDGIQNPSDKSPSHGKSESELHAEIASLAAKIRREGWPVYLIKLPFSQERGGAGKSDTEQRTAIAAGTAQPSSGGAPTRPAAAAAPPSSNAGGETAQAGSAGTDGAMPDVVSELGKALGTPVTEYRPEDKEELAKRSLALPELRFPDRLGKRGYTFSFDLGVRNRADTELRLELSRVILADRNVLAQKSFLSLGPGKSGVLTVAIALPETLEPGPQELPVELFFADGVRAVPAKGILAFTLAPSPLAGILRTGAKALLFALLCFIGIAAVIVVLLLLRKTPARAAAPVVAAVRASAASKPGATASIAMPARNAAPTAKEAPAATPAPVPAERVGPKPVTASGQAATVGQSPATHAHTGAILPPQPRPAAVSAPAPVPAGTQDSSPLSGLSLAHSTTPSLTRPPITAAQKASYVPRIARQGSLEVELRVVDQNPHIGRRNIHLLHAGASKTVGGGRSDYLVFLVPVPAHAAELHFDGESCVFVPLKPELFPDLEGPVADCLGRDIRMVSRRGYPLILRFTKYERPEDKINRLLHCIETPGLFSNLDP